MLTGVGDALVDVDVTELTLPPLLTVALVAQVVWRVGAEGLVGAGAGGARGEDLSAGGSTVRQLAQTGETGHAVHAGALVQAGAGSTLIDVHLAQVTSEALAALAVEAVELVDARASVVTGAGQAVVSVQVTVLAHPPGLTVTAVPVDVVSAYPLDTRAAATLVHLRVAVWGFEALGTHAVEAVLLIHTRAPVSTGAGGALVYFHITLGTGEAGLADTVIAVDSVFADTVVTWVAGAVVKVYLAVGSGSSMLTLADVFVD